MKNTCKRLLALALVLCSILSYAAPTANAGWFDDFISGGSKDVTYNFVQTGDGYNKIPNDPAGKSNPVAYTILGGDYLASCTQKKSIPARFAAGSLKWTYEASTAGNCGTTADLEHLPLTSGNRYAENSWRSTMGQGQWIAVRIKSPGAGAYTVKLGYRKLEGAPTVAVYIMEAEGTAITDFSTTEAHDTTLERRDAIHAALDPDNRVGKVDQNVGTTGTDYTAYIGNYTFEANKEYIVVFENYKVAAISGSYLSLSNLVLSPGATSGTETKGDPEVRHIQVEKNVVPAADGGYMAALVEVNGHDYYFMPLEGGKMAIFDLDKHVAGEPSLVKTVTTNLYYPTHATVTNDGRVIVGGDGKKLYVFNTKTMTGYNTPDFRKYAGLANEGHNQGSHYGSDGYLYYGTLYGGHAVQYNFDTKVCVDLGDLVCADVRAMAGITAHPEEETGGVRSTYYHNGYLYAKADSDNYTLIVKVDVAQRKPVAAINVTEQLHGAGVPHGLTVLGDKYVIAGGSGGKGMVLIDIATFTLVKYDDVVKKGLFSSKSEIAQDAWDNGMIGHASEVINGKQYFTINNGGLYSYDVATGKMARENTSHRGLRTGQKTTVTLDTNKDGTPETYIVTFAGSGLRLFDVAKKTVKIIGDLKVDLSAVGGSAINIGTTYDNVLYIGAWNNWNCAAFDTETETISTRYVTGGQTDSQTHYVDENGKFHLISGNYSACVVYEIDPNTKTGYGGDTDTNIIKPLISNMKKYDQKRIHTVAAGDGYVFAGTIPTSYVNGGGVGTYNIATGKEDFIHFKQNPTASEKCVPAEFSELWDLAVKGIVYSDGRLYGATTRSGGSGAGLVEGTSAQVFVLDYKNMKIEATLDLRDYLTLVDADSDGAEDPINYVGGISVDPVVEGRIWGIVSDVLFCFEYDKNTKTFNVQEVLNLGHKDYQSSGGVGQHNRKVVFDTANNQMFVSFYNAELQQIKISNWNAAIGSIQVSSNTQIYSDSPETYALGADNNLYFAMGTSLYMKPVNVVDSDWTAAKAMDAQIEALGKVTADSIDDVQAAREAYNALSLRDKALVQEYRELQEAEAQVLDLQIQREIAVVTANSVEALSQLLLRYDDLEESQQRYVQSYADLLVAYEQSLEMEYNSAAYAVVDAINNIPNPATLADENVIIGVRNAYEALQIDLKPLVDNLSKLETAEAQIQALKDAAAAVQTQINNLNVTSVADAEKVAAAKNAYEALSSEQKALVDTAKLDAAIAALAIYVEAAEVQDKIDALPANITLTDETAVVAARTAYDALSDAAKAVVNTDKLVAAETKIANLKAAKTVQDQIDALPANVTLNDQKAIDAARAAYDALSEDIKSAVNAEKLIAAEAKLADLVAVDAAQKKITALPDEIAIENINVVKAARAAYDALTDKQKAQVDSAKLVAAEATLEKLIKNAVPSTQEYDIRLYMNPDFYTDCTKYTYNAELGRIPYDMPASKAYNSKYTTIAKWFYGNYPGTIGWGIELTQGSELAFTFRGEADQGMRMTAMTTAGTYGSLRIFVPAAGLYSFDFMTGNVGMNAEVYIVPANTYYAESRMSDADIKAAMTSENKIIDKLYATSEVTVANAAEYYFAEPGDYVVIFKALGANSKGMSLKKITLNPVLNEETAVAKVGEELFLSLNDAFAYQVENSGENVSLFKDVQVSDLVLESNAVLDLNGYTLEADSVLTYESSAIIDSSENSVGVLKLTEAEGNMLSENNPQLPIYDAQAGGYRFFQVNVKAVAVTGKGSSEAKYWFKVEFENFEEVYKLIQAGSQMDIGVKMTWNGGEAGANATGNFVGQWAEAYRNNNGIYITVTALNAEGLDAFSLIPCMMANGVAIKGGKM